MTVQTFYSLSINRLARPHRNGPLVRCHSKMGAGNLPTGQASPQVLGKRPNATASNCNAISSVAVHNLTACTLSP